MALTATTINNILTRLGVTATARVYESASFDPTTNTTTEGSPTDYTVKVIPPHKNKEGYQKSELITHGKGWTGIANKDLQFDVKAGLILIINSKTWTVVGVTPLSNNSGVLAYLMEIESGS
jgi:hypothetical protein